MKDGFLSKYRKSFIGKKINRLTILEIVPTERGKCIVTAICECKKIKNYKLSAIISGNTKSCGCLNIETITKHGKIDHPLYSVRSGMIDRCTNPKNRKYDIYGGSGVTVCKEWLDSYESFYNWAINNGWRKGLQLDKDILSEKLGLINKIYSPDTCMFVTRKDNARHTSQNRILTHEGNSLTVIEWSEKLNISHLAIRSRLNLGWSTERTLTEPININYVRK